MMNVKAELPQW